MAGERAASMLMKWVVEWAEKEKLGSCLLQASTMATEIGFYEKFGFRIIGKQDFVDEEKFPGRIGSSVTQMVRVS